jgi:putative membrane protein
MPRGFADDAAIGALEGAVRKLEASSSAELVIAVRRQAQLWLHAHVIAGGVAAFVALAYMLYSDFGFGLLSILIDPFVIGIAIGAAMELWPGGKRFLTSRKRRRAAVERAARAAFYDRGVHHTRGRTGMLLYIAVTERMAALVPDDEAEAAWTAIERTRVVIAIEAAIPGGGESVAKVLEGLVPEIAKAMPRAADDVNELPDALDMSSIQRPPT